MCAYTRRVDARHALAWILAVGLLLACYLGGNATAQKRSFRVSEGLDAIYPKLPSQVTAVGGGTGLPLLRKSASLTGIVAWAGKSFGEPAVQYHSVLSGDRGASCFAVLHDVGSGMFVWKYILYAQRVTSGNSDEWQAVAVGTVGSTKSYDYVRCVYIDGQSRDLVFVGNDGKDIRRVPLPRSPWIR